MTYFGNLKGLPVGDVRLSRDRIVAVPSGSVLLPPLFKRAIRIGGVSGSISIQSIQTLVVGTRYFHTQCCVRLDTCLLLFLFTQGTG